MGLFGQVGGVGTSILRERPTRLISARYPCQEPHDPQQLVRRYGIAAGQHVETQATLKSAHRDEPEAFRTLPIVAFINGVKRPGSDGDS